MTDTSSIIIAHSDADFEAGKSLFTEYANSLTIDLAFQRFADELQTIRVQYGPPSGALLLAEVGGQVVGCAGVRRQAPDIAELKRMYVQPGYRGYKLGKLLLERSLSVAADLGYQKIRLDTLAGMTGARRLYEHFGFEVIPAYYPNPHEDAIYMEKVL
nr:GNAT family N-acetyltransferase [uncultured Dyadobacter sp.]